ncbi:MAG: hypothetical protein RLZZ628_4165 [Bacteroidota bacterium]|jgi:hypothetical protein
MKEIERNQKIVQTLDAFENLGKIEASEEWHQTLMHKLVESNQASVLGLSARGYILCCLFFITMNAVCIFNFLKPPALNRTATLHIISKELLINVVAINN